jgi:hypothetical protein
VGAILKINYERPYGFYLVLRVDQTDQTDRVRALAGDGGRDASGRTTNNGLPILVHLSVERIGKNGAEPIINSIFSEQELEGFSGDAFYKIITVAMLKRGTYQVKIKALESVPELRSVSVHFKIHSAERK